jgi:hypothetical protein
LIVWFFVFEIRRGRENRSVNENKAITVNRKETTATANPMANLIQFGILPEP